MTAAVSPPTAETLAEALRKALAPEVLEVIDEITDCP